MHHDPRWRPAGREPLATSLGWFSVALGLTELAAPRYLSRFIGLPDSSRSISTLRTMGLRELANGIAILAQPDNPAWMWSRVGGDLVDLSALQRASASGASDRTRVRGAAAAVLGVTALDVLCARRLGLPDDGSQARPSGRARLSRSVTVNCPVEEVYAFWRDYSNLPRFMRYLDSVTETGDGRSLWRSKGPAGLVVEWTSETVEDREGALHRLADGRRLGRRTRRRRAFPAGSRRGAARRSVSNSNTSIPAGPSAAGSHGCSALAGAADRRGPAAVQAADGDRRDPAVGRARPLARRAAGGRPAEDPRARGGVVDEGHLLDGHEARRGSRRCPTRRS